MAWFNGTHEESKFGQVFGKISQITDQTCPEMDQITTQGGNSILIDLYDRLIEIEGVIGIYTDLTDDDTFEVIDYIDTIYVEIGPNDSKVDWRVLMEELMEISPDEFSWESDNVIRLWWD